MRVLYERVLDLEKAETLRAAEHHAMVDQLDRLYKRISMRIAMAREGKQEETGSESPLALRQRLGR